MTNSSNVSSPNISKDGLNGISKPTLLALINIRGLREQAFKFAFGWKGGMKQCYTAGCEIFTPIHYALNGVDISSASLYDRVHIGELDPKVLYSDEEFEAEAERKYFLAHPELNP